MGSDSHTPEHDVIFLEPRCCAQHDRVWCEDDVWPIEDSHCGKTGIRYLLATPEREAAPCMKEALEALIEASVSLAARHEASMAVWKDKISPRMISGMRSDLDKVLYAGALARAALSKASTGGDDVEG